MKKKATKYEVTTVTRVLLHGRSEPNFVEHYWTVYAASKKQATISVRNAGHGTPTSVKRV